MAITECFIKLLIEAMVTIGYVGKPYILVSRLHTQHVFFLHSLLLAADIAGTFYVICVEWSYNGKIVNTQPLVFCAESIVKRCLKPAPGRLYIRLSRHPSQIIATLHRRRDYALIYSFHLNSLVNIACRMQ